MSNTATLDRICPKHRERLRLWRDGQGRPLRASCHRCHAEREQSRRARLRARRFRRGVNRVLRVDAKRVAPALDALVGRIGGWDRLLDGLSPWQAASLTVRLVTVRDQLLVRARERDAREQHILSKAAHDRMLVATAERILRELPPRELSPILNRLLRRARRVHRLTGDGDGV
jgi:hypothetical protein